MESSDTSGSRATRAGRPARRPARLEYRGYDSAGVAIVDDGRSTVRRATRQARQPRASLRDRPLPGRARIGIGHTRWATHGKPSSATRTPPRGLGGDRSQRDHRELPRCAPELEAAGATIQSDTDTELIAHLIDQGVEERRRPAHGGARRLRKRLDGLLRVRRHDRDGSPTHGRREERRQPDHPRGRREAGLPRPATSRPSCRTRARCSS